MSQPEINIKLKKTRKAFLIEYGCGIFLILLFFVALSKGLPNYFNKTLLIIGLISFASAEFSRNLVRYQITTEKVIITKGIIQKHKKNIHFHPLGFVPDINVKQGFIQRFLNYGTVFVQGGTENQLEIKDINNPNKILKILEENIDSNRTTSSKSMDEESNS
jgi:uncharacterized membrane protein YdbT with pleckstrin-like domain